MGSGSIEFHNVPSKSPEEAEGLFKRATQIAEGKSRFRDHPIRNVFISFHNEDEAQVSLLRAQAKREQFGIEFRDYSIKEPIDEKWKREAADRISHTSATFVMIGPKTAQRSTVNWEIEESYIQHKRVIGIRIYKNRTDPVPELMKKNSASIVNWTMEEIRRELDRSENEIL